MFLSDLAVTINTRHDNAVVITRHIYLCDRTTVTQETLSYTLAALGPEPICPHLTVLDLCVGNIKNYTEWQDDFLEPRPHLYEPATNVRWSGTQKCARCPTMFWLMDGMNIIRPRHDSLSLEIYREMKEFKRDGDCNLTPEGKDGPDVGFLQYFTEELPKEVTWLEFKGSRDMGSFGADMLD
jgi:hypothetical protein